jgi:hypothetical protein
MPKLKIVE